MGIEKSVFEDLKVVEFASILAGPLVGSFFAELGAEVIKVENKRSGGDATRQWKLPREQTAVSAYYASANIHKQSILLDFKEEDDYASCMELLQDADVIITNFQKRTAEKLGVSLNQLKAHNPKAIIAQLNAYTYDDPRPGFDMIMQAETGFISMCGTPEGEMVKMPVALIDILAAHQLKEAILIALFRKYKENRGSIIHVSLYQSAIAALANQASNYLMQDHVPRPMGLKHPNIAPYGDFYHTNDKKMLLLAIGSDAQFEKLGKTLTLDDELLHTFKFNRDRVSSRNELNEVLQRYIITYSYSEISDLLDAIQVPYCTINNLDQVFQEHLAQEMVVEHTIENQMCKTVSGIAFTINPN